MKKLIFVLLIALLSISSTIIPPCGDAFSQGLRTGIRPTYPQDLTTTGSPTFADLTLTGDLTVDTNTLFVDSANDRVGIGTVSPIDILHSFKESRGLTAAHLSNSSYVFIGESQDAVIGLASEDEGGHGSGIDLMEVDSGVLADKWVIVRESFSSGSGLRWYYGTNTDYALNNRFMELSTSGELFIVDSTNGSLNIPTMANTPGLINLVTSGADDTVLIVMQETDQANPEFAFYGDFAGAGSSNNQLRLGSATGGWESNIMTWQGDGNTGFGTSTVNAQVDIWEGGTSTMQIDFNDVASSTALVLWNRADNAMIRVTVGANDTGGSGFRSLHIPNL